MIFDGWLNHVHGWWTEFSQSPNVLFIKYEDCKKDVKTNIRKIATFLEHELSDEQVMYIVFHKFDLTSHLSLSRVQFVSWLSYSSSITDAY